MQSLLEACMQVPGRHLHGPGSICPVHAAAVIKGFQGVDLQCYLGGLKLGASPSRLKHEDRLGAAGRVSAERCVQGGCELSLVCMWHEFEKVSIGILRLNPVLCRAMTLSKTLPASSQTSIHLSTEVFKPKVVPAAEAICTPTCRCH